MPAGFTRGHTVAGPLLFVPSAARREMARDGYRLLVRLLALHRSIGAAGAMAPVSHGTLHCHRDMNRHYLMRFDATLSSKTTRDPFLIGNDR
nr:hypothetical protein [Burkholderia ambifaria]